MGLTPQVDVCRKLQLEVGGKTPRELRKPRQYSMLFAGDSPPSRPRTFTVTPAAPSTVTPAVF